MKFLLLILLSFNLFAVQPGDIISAKHYKESTLIIGTIQQSILTESQFQSLQGNCWVKLSGQNISGSDLANLTGISTLPDASGRFLRNAGGNASALGTLQEDAFQGHIHQTVNRTGSGGSPYDVILAGTGGDSVDIDLSKPVSDGINGEPRTANETRPKNLTVNFFIKINNNCN